MNKKKKAEKIVRRLMKFDAERRRLGPRAVLRPAKKKV